MYVEKIERVFMLLYESVWFCEIVRLLRTVLLCYVVQLMLVLGVLNSTCTSPWRTVTSKQTHTWVF
jgi:small-conductance mechanosensitive channel